MGGGTREISFSQHVGRAFRMSNDLHRRVRIAIGAQFLAGETLMHFTVTLPQDQFHFGLRGDIFAKIFIRQKDHAINAEAFNDLHRIR